jgi:hypothetical protein
MPRLVPLCRSRGEFGTMNKFPNTDGTSSDQSNKTNIRSRGDSWSCNDCDRDYPPNCWCCLGRTPRPHILNNARLKRIGGVSGGTRLQRVRHDFAAASVALSCLPSATSDSNVSNPYTGSRWPANYLSNPRLGMVLVKLRCLPPERFVALHRLFVRENV